MVVVLVVDELLIASLCRLPMQTLLTDADGAPAVVRLALCANPDALYALVERTVPFADLWVGTPGGRKKAPRRVKSYAADASVAAYAYSGQRTTAETPIPPELLRYAADAARQLGAPVPNYLLVQEYEEDSCICPHADDEPTIVPDSDIISISVGHERDFVFHPKQGGREVARIRLRHGAVVAMRGSCQRSFRHSIPRATKRNPCPATRVAGKPTTRRFNLTFRHMIPQNK
jgi:alkylated DNA repair dioxygenase AlkB